MPVSGDRKTGRAYIGTSGWNYKHWSNGVFYPPKLPQKRWLEFYSKHFDTVEVNSTFYHLVKKSVFEHWHQTVPDNFLFVVKASRYITHLKRLKEPEVTTKNFLDSITGLGDKLGPILFQLPPSMKAAPDRLQSLIDTLNQQKLITAPRLVLEVREESWLCDEIFDILKRNNIALCFADWPGLNVTGPVTANFVYLRRHGPADLYSSDYPIDMLQRDAENIKKWLEGGKDVFAYFNNDMAGYAVKNARELKELIL